MSDDHLVVRGTELRQSQTEWRHWAQGNCLTYAIALIRIHPGLRFGTLYDGDEGQHHFAHDDTYAYDSSGRHPLLYLGVGDWATRCGLNEDPAWYETPDEDEIPNAIRHAAHYHILTARRAELAERERN